MLENLSFNSSLADAVESTKTVRYVIGSNGFFELVRSRIYDALIPRRQLLGCPNSPLEGETVNFQGEDYIVSKDGFWQPSGVHLMYELKKTLPNTQTIQPYFHFHLPLIPYELLYEIVTFFRDISTTHNEVLVEIMFDKEKQEYFINVPRQEVSTYRVVFESTVTSSADKIIKVAEFHSHHVLKATFSQIDDADETRAGLIYGVIGGFKQSIPEYMEYSFRIRNKGDSAYLTLEDLFAPCKEKVNEMDLQAKIKKWKQKIFISVPKQKK